MTRQSKTTKLQREADLSKRMAEYLTKTGFRSLGDALAFYAGSAAPPRSEGMIEVETEHQRLTGPLFRPSLADVFDRFSPARYEEYYEAAEAHPDWTHDGDRLTCLNPFTRQDTPEKLLRWYRRGK